MKREPAEPQGFIKLTGVGIPRLQAGEDVNILHALGIMLCIGWWAAGIALSLRQRADIDVYGLMGGFILTCVFAWIMDRRQTTGKETFPKLRDQIADFAVEYIASKSYRKNKDKEDE